MAIDNPNIKDIEWVRQMFMLPKSAIDDIDNKRRTYSSANTKYTDTTLGGNFAINSPPQYTRHADLKQGTQYSVSKGMGRYYSEAMDDNGVNVHMRFGLAEYNSLTTFFTNFYDTEAASLARTGESTGALYKLGAFAGAVLTIPLVPFVLVGRAYRFFTGKPYSKYYYLKPAMPLYWGAVNTMVNSIAINMGLVAARDIDSYTVGDDEIPEAVLAGGITGGEIEAFSKILPDIFKSNGTIDIFAVANRADRISYRENMLQILELSSVSSTEELGTKADQILNVGSTAGGDRPNLKDYIGRYHATKLAQGADEDREKQDPIGTWESGFADFFNAELRDGSQWITLKVNADRTINESFSNSVTESDIAQKINGMSSSAKSTRFSVADGNIGDGVIAGAVEGIVGGVKDVISGVSSGIGLSGLAALGGSAFVDIPKHWDSSTANLPAASYTLELRAPYGNKMSIFTNIYVPLAMLLAGTLPISTGKQSFTSPFLLELFSKGRNQTRMGMIDSLSITRGTGNIGWSIDTLPLGIDVTFSVVDMSSVMHMPLNEGAGLFDDDSAYTDYLAVLGGLSLHDQVYPWEKFKRNLSGIFVEFDKYTSPAYHASNFAAALPGRILSAVAKTTTRA